MWRLGRTGFGSWFSYRGCHVVNIVGLGLATMSLLRRGSIEKGVGYQGYKPLADNLGMANSVGNRSEIEAGRLPG